MSNVTENAGLVKLEGTADTKGQDFVLTSQVVAADDGFRNVSKIWYDKTISYEKGLELLEQGRAATEDIAANVVEMVPTVHNGRFAFHHKPSDRHFVPTPHAMKQIGHWADTGTWYVEHMLENPVDQKGRELYARDSDDAATLAHVVQNGLRRLDVNKRFLWRTRNDGTMRAMLTDRYAIVDNRWLVEKLREFVPGGRLSHWRGDSDTLWGNILIPDTIRADTDSDYGGMLSIGNSEIGERRVSSMPSIFRAICMNGCIWGQTKGKGIRQVHRGRIDLRILALEIKDNLEKQIPLLPQGIERLLGLRTLGWDGAEAKPYVAALAKDFKLGKGQARAVLEAYKVESNLVPDYAKTLFGLTNAVTRAGQTYDNANWVRFDEIGGELTEFSADDWKRMVSRANGLSVKDVEEIFSLAL